METIKLNPKSEDRYDSELILSVKTWEKLKKFGDRELYKKYNKYGDYKELRIWLNQDEVDVEAHCLVE